jgi:hypothetical protein
MLDRPGTPDSLQSEHIASRTPDIGAVCRHQQQLTSAVCVLANMVEHHEPTAGSLARLDLANTSETVPHKPRSKLKSSQMSEWTASDTCGGPDVSEKKTQENTSTVGQPCPRPSKLPRLAAGSRRRRAGGSHVQTPPVSEAAGAAEFQAPMCEAQLTQGAGSGSDSQTDTKQQGTFLTFACSLLDCLRQPRDAAAGKAGHKGAVQDTGDLDFLKLYLAILIGVIVYRFPTVHSGVAAAVDLGRVVSDMKTGLSFYVAHGAIEASSQAFLQSAVQSLENRHDGTIDLLRR